MRTTLTAAACFAFAMMGPVFAAETPPSANEVLKNIYSAMDKDRLETEDAVVANAESRVGEQVAALDAQSEIAPAITVASN